MRLHRLIYLSFARQGLQYPDLLDIMSKSEVNNSAAAITGMLCYGNGTFLQILEGERQAINKTYLRIAKDDRHHSPEIIHFSEAQMRSFSTWSMKLVQLEDTLSKDIEELVLRFSSGARFSPGNMSAEQCLQFMKELNLLFLTR